MWRTHHNAVVARTTAALGRQEAARDEATTVQRGQQPPRQDHSPVPRRRPQYTDRPTLRCSSGWVRQIIQRFNDGGDGSAPSRRAQATDRHERLVPAQRLTDRTEGRGVHLHRAARPDPQPATGPLASTRAFTSKPRCSIMPHRTASSFTSRPPGPVGPTGAGWLHGIEVPLHRAAEVRAGQHRLPHPRRHAGAAIHSYLTGATASATSA
jgi:hypothetical protein